MIYTKHCVVCGKAFETVNSRYILCSDACRKTRKEEQIKKSHQKNYNREIIRYYYRINAKPVICKICGKPVKRIQGTKNQCGSRFHEKCIIADAITAILEGNNSTDTRVTRARNTFNYTIKELKELIKENEDDRKM